MPARAVVETKSVFCESCAAAEGETWRGAPAERVADADAGDAAPRWSDVSQRGVLYAVAQLLGVYFIALVAEACFLPAIGIALALWEQYPDQPAIVST